MKASMRLSEVAREFAAALAEAEVPSPEADARWLIEGVTGIDPHTHGDDRLDAGSVDPLGRALARRQRREPLQLIVGRTGFRYLEVLCSPGVFIPRPESEIVAGLAIESAMTFGDEKLLVIDACTGSGAIACSIASEVPGTHVTATDLDPKAVALARANASRVAEGRAGVPGFAHGAQVRVEQGDLFTPLDESLKGNVHVVVANPPYLPASDRGNWQPEVADHDPEHALIAGPDGHEIVEAVLAQSPQWLRPSGVVVVEIDERRAQDALRAARNSGLEQIRLISDLAGAERAIVGRKPR